MEANSFKVKRHEKSDRQKYMEYNFACTLGSPECFMKISSERLESPPPKPPRRRYSDQLSIQSLGNYSSVKKNKDENLRTDLKPRKYNTKPAYLSLPASLTSDGLNECDDTSNLFSYPIGADQLKHSRESEFYAKTFFDNLKIYESSAKQSFPSNKFSNKEKSQSSIPEVNNDYIFSKHHYENVEPHTVDKLLRNPINSRNICINQNLKYFNKECHRRHHSDPVISSSNFQSDNVMKLNYEQCCDNISCSAKKRNKFCDSSGSCCKKSYFILQELKILKEINGKLWHHLCSLQMCIENMRKRVYDECTDVSVSGLLSNIYYAQKTKDSVMEERLKLVLEERDTALHELEDIIHILSKPLYYADGEKETDKDIKQLLGEIGCTTNPSKFFKYQRILLSQVHNFKESKQDYLSHKLRDAMIERDNALEKVKNLEEEVKDLKLCYDLWYSDNKHWEFTMFDIISQVINQRDAGLSKVDNGFDARKYRAEATNRLDSIEYQNMSSYESRSKTIESLKNHPSMHINDKPQHSISKSEEIMELKEEILLLNKTLEGERKKREHTEEKCFRLERLIHVLRKKLNGQNIGVPV